METLYHVSPNLTHLKTFGCECFPLLTPYTSHKLFPKTTPCVFIGYPLHTKGYYCLDPVTHRIYTSRHVLFNETIFPGLTHPTVNSSQFRESPSVDSWLNTLLLQHTCSHKSMVISPPSHESNTITTGQCTIPTVSIPLPVTDLNVPYNSPTDTNIYLLSSMPLPTGQNAHPAPTPTTHAPTAMPANPIPNTNPTTASLCNNTPSPDLPIPHIHIPSVVPQLMQTRSKNGIFKLKLTYAALIDYTITKPTSYTMASKHSGWCTTMDEEFQALKKQGTWSLVPLPISKIVVGCKWVYKLKTHSDGTIARYKARLVVKGFHQQHGIDFNETFSPVIKPPIVRLIISLVVSLNWPLLIPYFATYILTLTQTRVFTNKNSKNEKCTTCLN
jgi:hypothetical protein